MVDGSATWGGGGSTAVHILDNPAEAALLPSKRRRHQSFPRIKAKFLAGWVVCILYSIGIKHNLSDSMDKRWEIL